MILLLFAILSLFIGFKLLGAVIRAVRHWRAERKAEDPTIDFFRNDPKKFR